MSDEGALLTRRRRRVQPPSSIESPSTPSETLSQVRTRRREQGTTAEAITPTGLSDARSRRRDVASRAPPMPADTKVDPGMDLDAPILFDDLVGNQIVNMGLPPCIIPNKPDRFLELPVIMCTCKSRKISQSYIRVTNEVEIAERDFFEQNQRNMSADERGDVIERLLHIEKTQYGIVRECCLNAVKHPMIITPTSQKKDAGKYRGFNTDVAKLESYGNMKLDRGQLNPVATTFPSVAQDIDDVDYNPMMKIASQFKLGQKAPVAQFPQIPVIGDYQLYNEFENMKIESGQDSYKYIGTAHTGLPGYETKVIRRKNIISR